MKSKYTFNEIEEFLDKTSKLKISNVYIQDLLTSGKSIGTIKVDDTSYNLLAPATYAWSEITSKPTTLAGYGITNAVLNQDYINLNGLATERIQVMGYGNPDDGWKTYSSGLVSKIRDNGFALQGLTNTLFFRGIGGSVWDDTWHEVLHTGNYASVLDNAYLKLSGGTIQNLTGNMCPLYLLGNDTYVALGLSIGKNQPQAYLAFDGSNLRYVKPDTSWNTLLHAGNYESIVGEKFLPLAGGKIEGTSAALLKINRTNGNPYIAYYTNGTLLGYIGVYYNEQTTECIPSFMRANGNRYAFVHEGNFNYYGTTLASGTWGIDISGRARGLYKVALEENFDLNTKLSGGGIVSNYASASYFVNKPSGFTYGSILQIASAYLATSGLQPNRLSGQLAWDINHGSATNTTNHLWWRATGDGSYEHSNWRQIAFTDSDITGNAASATKLATPRSLWGNSFDGTADINGDIHLAADKGIVASNGYAVLIAPSYLLLGYAQSELGQTTYLDGNDIYLRYGKNHVPAMYINSSGNVTIGASDLAGESNKLFVNGIQSIKSDIYKSVAELNATAGNANVWNGSGNSHFTIANNNNRMSFFVGGILNERKASIQVGHLDPLYGNSTGSLCLNPYGGNVGIGTTEPVYKLDVRGTTRLDGVLYNNAYNVLGNVAVACFVINKSGDRFGIGPSTHNSANLSFGLTSDSEGTWKSELITIRDNGYVGIGTVDPKYKLDVSGTIRAAKSIMSYAKDGYSQVELLYGNNAGWVLSQRGAEASKDFGIYSLVNGVDTCRFRIKEDGNVGIGTVNPSEKLHVNGSGIFGASTETKIRLNNGNIGIAGNTYQRIIGGYSNDYSSVLGGLNIYVASNALQLLWLGTNSERWFSADARYSTLEADWRLYVKAGLTVSTGQSITFVDANGNNHILSGDDTAGGLKIDDKIITVN